MPEVRPFAVIVSLAVAAASCSSDNEEEKKGPPLAGPGPYGPIATTALEAWPKAPKLAPLSRQDVGTACITWARCNPKQAASTQEGIASCVGMVEPFAERAIPIGQSAVGIYLSQSNERAEFFVPCVIEAGSDCAAVEACLTPRISAISCQEDGCHAVYDYKVTCNGSVARLETSGSPVLRDCARAMAECDPASHTGCTDRPFTQCNPDVTRSDRCDGNIRLGCDGKDQVSYHDCARLGGTCGKAASGSDDCLYPTALATPCISGNSHCEGSDMLVCVAGDFAKVPATDLCKAP